MREFDEQAELAIPAEVNMISGTQDTQTSADVYNVDNHFEVNVTFALDTLVTAAVTRYFWLLISDVL